MKRIVIFIFLIINTLIAFGQGIEREYSYLEKFLIQNSLDESCEIIEIDKLDLVTSDDIKKPFIQKIRGYAYFDHLIDNYDFFKDDFKVIDLNGDGKLDIFYSGYLGGASDLYSFVFLNTGNDFIQIFSGDMGLFLFASKQPDGKIGLIYCFEGPAADCPVMSRIEFLSFEGNDMKTKNIVSYPNDSKIPDVFFDKPLNIKVRNKKYYLRSSPEIVNKDNGCDLVGNIFFTYTTGDKGKAYASETDDTGRVWFYVIMENKIAGWMSSKFLDIQ